MIRLKNVTKYYNENKTNQTVGVRDVTLAIEPGEMIAVTGPSGAGKSTLLHIIAGLSAVREGSYLFDGRDIFSLSDSERSALRNDQIGLIRQDFALIDEYSVADNVLIPLYFNRREKATKEKALAALEQVGIAHLAKKRASELSGGEKQRCAIARCLCQKPQVILADEPTGQLDSANAKKIIELLFELNRSGITVLLVTHDEALAAECPRVLSMRDGRIERDSVQTPK